MNQRSASTRSAHARWSLRWTWDEAFSFTLRRRPAPVWCSNLSPPTPPDEVARGAILTAVAQRMPLEEGLDLAGIAAACEVFSAADIAALARQAALTAMRENIEARRSRQSTSPRRASRSSPACAQRRSMRSSVGQRGAQPDGLAVVLLTMVELVLTPFQVSFPVSQPFGSLIELGQVTRVVIRRHSPE